MEEAKFNNLCSHYRDTFDVHRTSMKQRDTLFYGLLIILSVFTLQLSSTEAVTIIVSEFISKSTGIKLGEILILFQHSYGCLCLDLQRGIIS